MKENDNTTPYKAAEYDGNVRRTIPYYEALHKEAIDLIRTVVPEPALWLDTGCGTGHLVEQALAFFPKTRFVLADPSQAMLDQARQRLQSADPVRLSFVHGPTSDLTTGRLGGTADVITAMMCHHYARPDERRRMTETCHDLLPPGGVYVTFENIRPDSQEATRIGLQRWGHFQQTQSKHGSAVERHLARFDVEFFPITVREHLQLLQDCGFRTSQILWYSCMQAGFYAIK